jgi:DNA-binding helix-hairpin-helix protein with protein kinase domain
LRYLAAAGVGIIVMVSIAVGVPQGLFVVLWVLAMLRDSERGESEIEARRRVVEACEGDLARAERRYATEGSDRPFVRRLEQLEAARNGVARAQATEAREREELVERIRQARLHRHLCRHRVADAPIPRLGPVALRELEGNGILTAADVEAPVFDRRPELHARAPQVEPELVEALLAWRNRVEREFVFDLAKGVRPGEFESLERQQKARREAWEQALRSGAAELLQLRRSILARRQELLPDLDAVHRRLAQARADLAAVSA